MGLTGFKSGNHPQQTGRRGARDDIDDRGTDPALFAELNRRFGPFTLDVAASRMNKKCERYYSIDDDGLAQPWDGRVFCNPPYSDLASWAAKAWREWNEVDGDQSRVELIVMLVPASRCEQAWWQDHVEPFRDQPGGELRTEFLRGRRRFVKPGATSIGPNERPPFGSVLLIWERGGSGA